MGIVVIDDKDAGVLTVDIIDILQVLGSRGQNAMWRIFNIECVGPATEDVDLLSERGEWISGRRLSELAAGLQQTIDGTFVASSKPGDALWVTIRAIDSTCFEVESDDEDVLRKIRARFGKGYRALHS